MTYQRDQGPPDINLDEFLAEEGAPAPEGSAGPGAPVPPAGPAAEPEAPSPAQAELAKQLAKLQAEKDELFHTLIRRQADFENYRKRIERERKEDGLRASAALLESLLPVLDAFERAIPLERDDPAFNEYRKGFELIYRQLWDTLVSQGLERIEAKGQPFDPNFHHALERLETTDVEDGTVVEELQRGYKLRDKVLRPAMVRVAVHPAVGASAAERTAPSAADRRVKRSGDTEETATD